MVLIMMLLNVSVLLEMFYFFDDVMVNSVCSEVLRFLYDYVFILFMFDFDCVSRFVFVFFVLLELYYVLQGGISDFLCLFWGGGEGCDFDVIVFFVLIVV